MKRGVENSDDRRRELAKIHIWAQELGMDTRDKDPNGEYRSMLYSLGRVHSSAKLNSAGRKAVLDHLRACGAARLKHKRNDVHHAGAPHNIDSPDCGPMLHKIEAYLAQARRPWAYADGLAKKLCHVERLAWCRPDDLRKIIAALEYDARRHNRYRGPGKRKSKV